MAKDKKRIQVRLYIPQQSPLYEIFEQIDSERTRGALLHAFATGHFVEHGRSVASMAALFGVKLSGVSSDPAPATEGWRPSPAALADAAKPTALADAEKPAAGDAAKHAAAEDAHWIDASTSLDFKQFEK